MFCRDGEKVGLFTTDGFDSPKFHGIVKELQQNGKLFVAIKEHLYADSSDHYTFKKADDTKISYYELETNGNLVKLADNWKIFDPRKYNWFPEKFKEDNDLYYDDVYYDDGNDSVGGWTRRELEDAADAAYEGYSRLELGLD